MSAPVEIKRVGRSLGIVAVFSILGPIAVAATLVSIALVIGVPLLLLLLLVFEFKTLLQWASPIMFVIVMFTMLGTLLPAFFAGTAFAIAAVYFGANSLRVAVLSGVLAGIGIVVMGFLVTPSESSALLLPRVEGADQALGLSVFVAVIAALAASICWLVTRKLHSTPS